MITAGQVAIVGGLGAAAYLVYDVVSSQGQPGPAGVSLPQRVINTVTNSVSRRYTNTVPAVKVGMPSLVSGDSPVRAVDASSPSANNLSAISALCTEILCNGAGNGGDVAAAFASCESQTGNLGNACYNCSLFNIHYTDGAPYPCFYIANSNEPLISFRTGASSDVEGFRRCIEHFKQFLLRRSPEALEAIRARDFDRFQIAISRINYSGAYTNSVQGNTLRDPFIRRRYDRLVAAGLLPRR